MKIAIIGAGASGLFCAGLIKNNYSVTLFDKNIKPGVKLSVTGNGRCNVTNAKDPSSFLTNIPQNSKFLFSALNKFSPNNLMDMLTNEKIELIEENDNKIYPKSNKSKTIIDFLLSKLKDNVKLNLQTNIISVEHKLNKFIVKTNTSEEAFDKLVIATGGKSYPITGSTGDGYYFAEKLGHSTTIIRPSLVGLTINSPLLTTCEGVAFNCKITIQLPSNKKQSGITGPVMITKTGLSGPAIHVITSLFKGDDIKNHLLIIDFIPELNNNELENKITNYIKENPKKTLYNLIDNILIKRLAFSLKENHIQLFSKTCENLSNKNINEVLDVLKNYKLTVTDFEPIERAVVTRGGVNTKEITPQTMESKLISGLYFIGEVLDVDGITGGYNLQIAWSTAFACALHLNKNL